MTGRPNDQLERARQRAGLTVSQLWMRYFAAGGGLGAIELDALLNGALQATRDECDLIAQILNERFTELGSGVPVPYTGQNDTGDDTETDITDIAHTSPDAVPGPPDVTMPHAPESVGAGGIDERIVAALDLEPDATAPGAARRWARQLLDDHGHPSLIDVTASGLTELVTNACVHARTPMTVTMIVRASATVRFQVRDHSPLLPAPRHADSDATGGRGMHLLSACGTWGVQELPDGKTVWFEPHARVDSVEL